MLDLSLTLASLTNQKVWGVVCNYSCDVLYGDLTYEEAVRFAQQERGPYTDAAIILMLEPMTNQKEANERASE